MKNLYTRAIIDLLNSSDADGIMEDGVAITKAELIDELNKNLTRAADMKNKRMAAYDNVHQLVIDTLTTCGPITCSELMEQIENEVPIEFTRSKLQHGLTHVWDEIEIDKTQTPYVYSIKTA